MPPPGRRPSGLREAALGAALSLALLGSGCALLVPPSWRPRAPMALAGPIQPDGEATAAATSASTEDLSRAVAADRSRLLELVSDPTRALIGGPSEDELRDIAGRLPHLQNELAERVDGESGARIRHPVIR